MTDLTPEMLIPVLGRKRAPSPLSILGVKCAIDLCSDIGITPGVGGRVAGMNDLGARGNHVSQGTLANQPFLIASVLDGHAAVRFDASNDEFICAAFAGITTGQSLVVYMVVKDRAGTGTERAAYYDFNVGGASNSGLSLFHYDANIWGRKSDGGGGLANFPFTTESTIGPRLYTDRIGGTVTGYQFDIGNTVFLANTGYPSGALWTPDRLKIGNIYGGGIGVGNCDLFRLIASCPAPSAAEHTAMLAFLRAQYPSVPIA